jgi:hypothetical protein
MKVPKLGLGHLDHSAYEKGRFKGPRYDEGAQIVSRTFG